MTRLRAWLSARGNVSWLEILAVVFVVVGILRLPGGSGEAQVFVLVGLVWATLAMARATQRTRTFVPDMESMARTMERAERLIHVPVDRPRCPDCGHAHGGRSDDDRCTAPVYTSSGVRACGCGWKP